MAGWLAVVAIAMGASGAAAADGTFVQVDLSRDTSTAVAMATRGPFSYSALHSDYEGGAATRVGVLYGLPLEGGVTVRLGPSFGVTRSDEHAEDDRELGAKATIDRYAPTGFGALYLLGEFDSIDRSWFLLAQATLGQSGVSVEVSAGGSDAYEDATLALARRLGAGPVSLRGGWRIVSEEIFLGLSVNTF